VFFFKKKKFRVTSLNVDAIDHEYDNKMIVPKYFIAGT